MRTMHIQVQLVGLSRDVILATCPGMSSPSLMQSHSITLAGIGYGLFVDALLPQGPNARQTHNESQHGSPFI